MTSRGGEGVLKVFKRGVCVCVWCVWFGVCVCLCLVCVCLVYVYVRVLGCYGKQTYM